MVLKLGTPGRPLLDGHTSWDSVAAAALSAWNTYLQPIHFSPVIQDPGKGSDGDHVNQVFFNSKVYGESFGGLVLAVSAAGTASTAHAARNHQLTITAHALSSVQVGKDHLIESDKAVRSGHTIGYTANSCTFDFAASKAHCLVTFGRPQGQLRMRVTVNAQTGASSGRITGGSGAYSGATGTVTGQQGAKRDSVKLTLRWTD